MTKDDDRDSVASHCSSSSSLPDRIPHASKRQMIDKIDRYGGVCIQGQCYFYDEVSDEAVKCGIAIKEGIVSGESCGIRSAFCENEGPAMKHHRRMF